MTQNPSPQTLNYSVPSAHDSRWGKGFLAVCGTFVLPGLGHAMVGRTRRGLGWFAAAVAIAGITLAILTAPSLTPLLLLLLPGQIFLFLAALIDAYFIGRGSNRPVLNRPVVRYLAGIGLLIVCVPINLAMSRTYRAVIDATGTHRYAITSNGMHPTIRPGDRILTHSVADPHRWDIVVFHPPGRADVFTQRIVGLPGEKVEVVGWVVRINDAPVTPPFASPFYSTIATKLPMTGCEGHPIKLGTSEYYLLGDSGYAFDSRCWTTAAPGHQLGAVPKESIVGRVTAIFFPPKRMHQFK